ncbi:MAG: saccharopine dehydrogenase NADP-binding domain-containing protein [Acidobacteriota bacterium]|nr:saccharopine dehydrogenase NADP-binding domain-containing protein [Acidobacteriota bacterium]
MTDSSLLIYGANGYTGELIAREAKERGLEPILAGRNRQAVESLAAELDFPARIIGLDDPGALRETLSGVAAILHAAGPFVQTSRPMVEACLDTGTHYLDITGEIAVFEAIERLNSRARAAGVVLLPGAGFDVVPTDCLAAKLAAGLRDATHLELAFCSDTGSWSRGTLKTMIEGMPYSGAIRRDGRIESVPLAYDAKKIDFSCGSRWAVTIPWGDVSTAFHTTGIPNIRVYVGMPPGTIKRMRALRGTLPIMGLKPVKRLAQWWVGRTVTGPGEMVRNTARTYVWGEAKNQGGERVTATLETPEAYGLTATTAVECARRVLAGDVDPGAWTPGRAFGPELLAALPGVIESPVESSTDQ